MSIKRKELIKKISEESGLDRKDVETVVRLMEENLIKALAEGKKVLLSGFATFSTRVQKGRRYVLPGAKEGMSKEKRVIVFEPLKKARKAIL